MFALVADVERYPQFLPWCIATRIKARDGDTFTADLIAAFGAFREQFTSRVMLNRPAMEIAVEYLDGPFEHLMNRWHFEAVDGGCMVHFDIDFALQEQDARDADQRRVHARGREDDGARSMTRAHELYGVNVS